jgi:hypothetical protein
MCLCPNCDAKLKNSTNNVAREALTQIDGDDQTTSPEIAIKSRCAMNSMGSPILQRHHAQLKAAMKTFEGEHGLEEQTP